MEREQSLKFMHDLLRALIARKGSDLFITAGFPPAMKVDGKVTQSRDLGVNVAPETFIEAIQEHNPDVVGFSAFLTTTMPMFKANINALEKAGIRDDIIVMVGGAPVTQEYADAVGADGYAADASSAVRLAKDLIEKKRSAVLA